MENFFTFDINNLSVITILGFIIGAGIKKIWVFGYIYDDMRKDRDEWKELALSSYELLKDSTSIIRKK